MLRKTLLEANPKAARMWDYDENNRRGLLPPRAISAGSNKRAQFRCLDYPEHVFDSKICDMTDRDGNNRGCRICRELGLGNSSAQTRTNVSFFEYIPEAKRMWDEKRNTIDGNKISPYANVEAYFKCEKGHRFKRLVSLFSLSPICPYCKPNIESEKPELLVFWDYDKNPNIKPTDVSPFSGDIVNWRCPSCGYEWGMSPQRINETTKNRCSQCGYKEKLKYGDTFRSFNPAATEYWDYEKNGNITPDNTRPNSREFVHIKCPNNPDHSTRIKVCAIPHFPPFGCRRCEKPRIDKDNSFPNYFPDLLEQYSSNNKRDPYTISEISQTEVEWYCKKHNHYWMASPLARTRGEKKCKHCMEEKHSMFSQMHSYLAGYYDEDKNLIPYSQITEKGNPEVWWQCEKGHSFPYRITNFSRKGKFDCPVCRGRIVINGETDLQSQYPSIACNYDVESNGKTPEQVSIYNTNPDTKWICEYGHTSKLSVVRKIANNGKCPKCQGEFSQSKSVIRTVRHNTTETLLDKYPMFDGVWDYSENKKRPEDFSSLHDEKIYALCPNKKHESYQVMITTLINNDFKCQACENKILVPGFNSLADLHPDWLQEWDYENNYLLCDPTKLLDNYSEGVWWICRVCGQIYKMAPNKYRGFDERGMCKCPYCKNVRPQKHYFA